MPHRILVADDSITVRRIVELAFGDSDIRVESVGSGLEALERVQDCPPDLVLADVIMPAPSGYELCREIKGSDRPIPVLLLRSDFEPFDEGRAVECGADGHLVKPFDADALLERVTALLARAESSTGEGPTASPDPPTTSDEPEASASPRIAYADDANDTDDANDVGRDDPASAQVSPTDVAAPASDRVDDTAPRPGPAPEPAVDASSTPLPSELPEAWLERIADRVVERLAADVVRDIAWEIVPDLAEALVKRRLREIEIEAEKSGAAGSETDGTRDRDG